MAFNGTEGAPIELTKAAQWTANYRGSTKSGETIAHFFGKDILNDIINQDGCMGIRMYYAVDDNGAKQLVIVGADANENDMLALVADFSCPCPAQCSVSNALNC